MMSGSCVASLAMGFSTSFEMFLVFQALLGKLHLRPALKCILLYVLHGEN